MLDSTLQIIFGDFSIFINIIQIFSKFKKLNFGLQRISNFPKMLIFKNKYYQIYLKTPKSVDKLNGRSALHKYSTQYN